ncbi:MAG: DUF493 domain-containing protein [Bacteroidetes bacterium]|nr:DUF493 domain-containing protein [Bacteroidota bacterium]
MGNNGSNAICNLFGEEKVNYPVNYDLKVIMDTANPDQTNKEKIIQVLETLNIPYNDWRTKNSSKGNYISFTVNITISSKSILEGLYKGLKAVPEIKYAI